MNKYIMEAVGTFFLVLTIGLVVGSDAGPLAPVAIGAVLMVMVYAGGHISGAHYNPAVTLAVFLRGRCPARDVLPYVVAQALAAAAAAGVALYLHPAPDRAPMSVAALPAIIAEFLFTFALAFVVLNVATAKGTSGNSFFGVAIGFTVLAGAFAAGSISGGAFNPAVVVGLVVLGILDIGQVWIHLLGDVAGGAAAAAPFRFLLPTDK